MNIFNIVQKPAYKATEQDRRNDELVEKWKTERNRLALQNLARRIGSGFRPVAMNSTA